MNVSVIATWPNTFVSNIFAMISRGERVAVSGLSSMAMAALFTSTSSLPNVLSTYCAAEEMLASEVTSSWMGVKMDVVVGHASRRAETAASPRGREREATRIW